MKKALGTLALALALGACDRIDTRKARAYACDPTVGDSQCPGGWHCGISGYCQDPAVAAAYPCRDDQDCSASWHCGVAHVCYDLADAGAVACRVDAGDCAPGWRCGLSGVCHDTSVGAAYSCLSDPDCEEGWRCGPGMACVDARAEALRPPTPWGALTVSRLSPVYDGVPYRVAASPSGMSGPWTLADGTQVYGNSAAFADDAGLVVQTAFTELPSASHTARTPLRGPPSGLAIEGPDVYLLDALGGERYRWLPDGGSLEDLGLPGLAGGQLRSGDTTLLSAPALVAFGDAGFLVFSPYLDAGSGLGTLVDAAGNPEPILDATTVEDGYTTTVVLAGREGLFFSQVPPLTLDFQLPDGGVSTTPEAIPFAPSAFANAQCDGGANPWLIQHVRANEYGHSSVYGPCNPTYVSCNPALAVSAVSAADPTSPPQIAVLQVSDFRACNPNSIFATNWLDPCPDAGALVDFRVTQGFASGAGAGGYTASLETRCQPASGSTQIFAFDVTNNGFSSGVIRRAPASATPVGLVAEASRELAYFEGQRLWWAYSVQDQPTASLSSIPIWYPPPTVYGDSAVGLFTGCGNPFDPSTGLVDTTCGGINGLPVQGAPKWMIRPDDTLDVWQNRPADYVPVGVFDGAASISAGLANPTIAPVADGGHALLVTGFDSLWAGEVDSLLALSPDAGPPTPIDVGVRVVPLFGFNIDELVAVGPAPQLGGDYTYAYALVNQHLFGVGAANSILWRADELALPVPGQPTALWTDGPRARLTYADGTTYSLPSRVQISGALPAPIQQLATLCGAAFALSDGGVYRLGDADGGVVGTWEPVDLTAVLPTTPVDFSSGQLTSTGRDLLIFGSQGETFSITDPCEGGRP